MSELDWSAPFEALEEGQSFRSRARTITEADIVGFAALTGDMHPQHTDAEWAAASRFGERIAHGMLLVSYAAGLVPFDPGRVIALRRIHNVVFKRPAKIGATVHVDGRIASLAPLNGDAGLVNLQWDIRDSSELLLCRATVDALWASSDPAATPAAPVGARTSETLEFPAGVVPC